MKKNYRRNVKRGKRTVTPTPKLIMVIVLAHVGNLTGKREVGNYALWKIKVWLIPTNSPFSRYVREREVKK